MPSWEALFDSSASGVPQGLYSRDALGSRLAAARLARGRSPEISGFLAGQTSNAILMEQIGFRADGGAIYPRFPMATGWMAAPLFLGAIGEGESPSSGVEAVLSGLPQRELYAAALLTALACAVFYALLLRLPEWRERSRTAWLAAAALGLATPLFAGNSQALWSHTGSTLWLCVFLWATWGHPLDCARRAALAGAALALAAWCRPSHLLTIAIAFIVLSVYCWKGIKERPAESGAVSPKAMLSFGGACGAFLLLAAFVNLAIYGEPLGPYIRQLLSLGAGAEAGSGAERDGFLNAAAGSLIAPSAGLFVFCPAALFALGGLRGLWSSGSPWGRWLVLTLALQWLAIARNPFWWGGWSWGPRLFADLMPLIWLAGIPPALAAMERGKGYLVVATLLVGVFLQGLGAYRYNYEWHMFGPDLTKNSIRLWNINEGIVLQTLRDGRPKFFEPWLTEADLIDRPDFAPRCYDLDDPANTFYGATSQISVVDDTDYTAALLRGARAWMPLPRDVSETHFPRELMTLDPDVLCVGADLRMRSEENAGPHSPIAEVRFPAGSDGRAMIGIRIPPRPIVGNTDILDEIVVAPLPAFETYSESPN